MDYYSCWKLAQHGSLWFILIFCLAVDLIFILESGDILTWGQNEYGQLGHNTMENALQPTPIALLPPDTGSFFFS